MHYRIYYENRDYLFRVSDRQWYSIDGTKVYDRELRDTLTSLCSQRCNVPMESFQPVKVVIQDIKKESKRKPRKAKVSKNKKWKLNLF